LLAARLTDLTFRVQKMVLVGEFIPRENHWEANGSEKAGKRKLGALLNVGKIGDAAVEEEVIEALISESFDVVRGVVDVGLREFGVAEQAAIDCFADGRLKSGFLLVVATYQSHSQVILKTLMPEAVEPVLLQERMRFAKFFANDQEAFVRANRSLGREALSGLPHERDLCIPE
jgi:hypothetical protein